MRISLQLVNEFLPCGRESLRGILEPSAYHVILETIAKLTH